MLKGSELLIIANQSVNIAKIAKDLIVIARKGDTALIEDLSVQIKELLDCSNILSTLVLQYANRMEL